MTSSGKLLQEMYDRLLGRFGPQKWWSAENTLEILIGIVVSQNTTRPNAQKTLDNLRRENLLSVGAVPALPNERLAQILEPAGHAAQKTKRLKNLLTWLRDRFEDDVERLKGLSAATLRAELLAVNGIGLETADNILLYACDRPVFVVDPATFRILQRHGLADEALTYEELQAFFADHLPRDAALFKEFHALLAKTGREFCRKQPLCDQCPLRDWGHRNFTAKD